MGLGMEYTGNKWNTSVTSSHRTKKHIMEIAEMTIYFLFFFILSSLSFLLCLLQEDAG